MGGARIAYPHAHVVRAEGEETVLDTWTGHSRDGVVGTFTAVEVRTKDGWCFSRYNFVPDDQKPKRSRKAT